MYTIVGKRKGIEAVFVFDDTQIFQVSSGNRVLIAENGGFYEKNGEIKVMKAIKERVRFVYGSDVKGIKYHTYGVPVEWR